MVIPHIPHIFIYGTLAAALAAVCAGVWWRRGAARRYGRACERKVAHRLRKLGGRDHKVLNDLLLPAPGGRTVQVDHVVVSTRGVFVIETKGHRGRIAGGEHDQYWEQRLMMRSRSFYNPLLQNDSHMRALRRALRLPAEVPVTGMVVFTDAWRLDVHADDLTERRRLLPDRHVSRTLDPERERRRRWWRRSGEVVLDRERMVMRLGSLNGEIKRRRRVISREAVEAMSARLRQLDIRDSSERRRHVGRAREAARRSQADITHGRCPRCGAQLVERQGDYGPFLACSAYPECRFICSRDFA